MSPAPESTNVQKWKTLAPKRTNPDAPSSSTNTKRAKQAGNDNEVADRPGYVTIGGVGEELLSLLDGFKYPRGSILDQYYCLGAFKQQYETQKAFLHRCKDDKDWKDKIKGIDEAYEKYCSKPENLCKGPKNYESELHRRFLQINGVLYRLRCTFFTATGAEEFIWLQEKYKKTTYVANSLEHYHSDGLRKLRSTLREDDMFPKDISKTDYLLLERAHKDLHRQTTR